MNLEKEGFFSFKEGIYEFDLLVEHRMAMSSRKEDGQQKLTLLVDFVPDKVGSNGIITIFA